MPMTMPDASEALVRVRVKDDQQKPARPGTVRYTRQIVYQLADTVRERDVPTYAHSRRVAIYAQRLAHALGWSRRAAQDLALAGLVHDLGKTWIGNDVLLKEGALSPQERQDMQAHPVIAARMLDVYQAPSAMIESVRSHHEAYDGSGYPAGLKGESIPLGARILTVADVFDALTSSRPYREPMAVEVAVCWIEERSARFFDPQVVTAFVALVRDWSGDFRIAEGAEPPLR
jgi:putative nucleotidyltransferase with HDIG domain